MNRLKLLSDYVDETERVPFAYGSHDCLLWVAGAIERITGVDHAAAYRGRYTSLAEAKGLIGRPLLQFVGETFPDIRLSRVSDGDIGAFRQGREWVFGIFIGPFLYVQTRQGIGIRPRSDASKAFRVS